MARSFFTAAEVYVKFLLLVLLSLLLFACSPNPSKVALIVASAEKSGFTPKIYPTTSFPLFALLKKGQNANLTVYLEGDGQAYLNAVTPSLDPTPNYPVAFWLAKDDPSQDHILYLARPGQYLKAGFVPVKYWTTARFSQDVLLALDQVISQVKEELGVQKIVLVGFSGGAALATLLAAKRQDVCYLATVAGNLNLACWLKQHNLSNLEGALDPLNVAKDLATLPQRHVFGLDDKVISKECLAAFCSQINPKNLEVKFVPNFGHTSPWPKVWDYHYHP